MAPRRNLQALMASNDTLKGVESMTLRSYCTSQMLIPPQHMTDPLGRALQTGDANTVATIHATQGPKPFTTKWGPTKLPIFNVLLMFAYLKPQASHVFLGLLEFVIKVVKYDDVDAVDLSGTTALMHAISTKPYLDLEIAQMLLDAGADINHRNRYGETAAHEIVKVQSLDSGTLEKAKEALRWFAAHGGDVDIAEGDGVTARSMYERVSATKVALGAAVAEGEEEWKKAEEAAKVPSRGGPCPCGSGRKYKKCCGKEVNDEA